MSSKIITVTFLYVSCSFASVIFFVCVTQKLRPSSLTKQFINSNTTWCNWDLLKIFLVFQMPKRYCLLNYEVNTYSQQTHRAEKIKEQKNVTTWKFNKIINHKSIAELVFLHVFWLFSGHSEMWDMLKIWKMSLPCCIAANVIFVVFCLMLYINKYFLNKKK